MSTQEVGRRRNGKQQACENCRRSKQSCDHVSPVCGRCRRKDLNSCFYHPAPMTQGYNGDLPSLETTAAPVTASRSTSLGVKRTRSPSLQTQSASPSAKSFKGGDGTEDDLKDVHPKRTPARAGPTNGLTIFRDNSDIRNIYDETTDSNTVVVEGTIDPATRAKIASTFKSFPSKSSCYFFLESYKALQDPLIPLPVMTAVIKSIFDQFEGCISPPYRRNPKALLEVLTKNEVRKWTSITLETFGSWPNICCGKHLRWEMLGLVYAFFGLASMQRQPEDELTFNVERGRLTRKEAACLMKECADMCFSMWKRSGTWNDIVVNLIMAIVALERLCSGDNFGRIRLLHCDLKYALNNRGFNRLRKLEIEEVTPATEYQRRLVMTAYELDKAIACFHGEQPELLARYYNLNTPLDVSDEALMGDEDDLVEAIKNLDRNGWNAHGKIYGISVARAKFELSKVKEKVMEISLRVDLDTANKRRRIDNAAASLKETMTSFPEQLRYGNTAPHNDGPPGFAYFSQAVIHLEYLSIDLCIEKIKLMRKSSSSQNYHDRALETMKTIHELWTRRSELTVYHCCFDWLLTNYGIPAAGVLSVTAYASIRTPIKTPYSSVPASQAMPSSQATVASASSSSGAHPRNPAMILSVSFSFRKTIALLTSFLEFMSWSRETDGNHKHISKLKAVIARVNEMLIAGRDGQGVSANNSFSSNSNPSNSQTRSANSSFGGSFGAGMGQTQSQSNDSSQNYFGSYPQSSSALGSFDFTTSANGSNTQGSNPSFVDNLGEHEMTQVCATPPLLPQAQAQQMQIGIGFQQPFADGMRHDSIDETLLDQLGDTDLLTERFLGMSDYTFDTDGGVDHGSMEDAQMQLSQPGQYMQLTREDLEIFPVFSQASQAGAYGMGGMSQGSQ